MHRIHTLLVAVFAVFATVTADAQTCNRPAPTPVSPANGATGVISPVLFTWTPVAGTYGYKLFASLDGVTFEQIGDTSAPDFSIDAPYNSTIYWYVEARFDECNSRSATFVFETATCDAQPAILIAPPDFATVGSPVTFTWNGVPEAYGYRVWLVSENAAGDDYDYNVVGDTTRTSLTARVPPGVYAWFIETLFYECDSSVSEIRVMEVPRAQNCSTAAATLLTPAGGAQNLVSPVRFSWTAVPNAIGYQLWGSLDGGDFQLVDETSATETDIYVGSGEIAWGVIAQFNGCDDTYSDVSTFNVPYNAECDKGVPFPISPPDGMPDAPTTLDFIWTPVSDATKYNVWIAGEDGEPRLLGSTTNTRLRATVPPGFIAWVVEVEFNGCPTDISPATWFTASASTGCAAPDAPDVYVDPEARSGDGYYLIWSPGVNTSSYEVQESTDQNFTTATTRTVTDILLTFTHTVSATTRYYYRIRSVSSCGLGFGPYSAVASIVITPNTAVAASNADLVASYGAQRVVVQKVRIPGIAGNVAGKTAVAQGFKARVDKPWMTVSPSEGIIPPEGIDLTVTADPRELPVGTNTATVILETTANSNHTTVPVSVNLVTPVSPNAGNSPLPNSLVIPAVAHAVGLGASFESDVRIANIGTQVMKYMVNFTPTRSDGTKAGQQSTIQIQPGETAALDDVLRNFYGLAVGGESVSGVLEIRPLPTSSSSGNATAPSVTIASSRTFAAGEFGTYGQYIPAIPFSDFVGRGKTISLQQVAESARYRTNLGLVEAAGEPASVVVSIYGDSGQRLGQYPIDMKPGEHMQLGRFMQSKGHTVNDGRIEVTVTSSTGKVTAYASVLDNATQDPLLVMPVDPSKISANRFVLPGIAAVGAWRSDVRLYNAGTLPVAASLQFYNAGSSDPVTKAITIDAGKVVALDNVLTTFYNLSGALGGSMVVTTTAKANLVVSARTYNQTANGTYGQFIPAVTVAEGVGRGDRALQLLQVEESERFYTNLGLVELTGSPVTVEISAFTPDSKVAVKVNQPLRANEFLQLGHILARLNLGTTYNTRIAVRVIEGNGRITAYASLIDNKTKDPTYVPAQ